MLGKKHINISRFFLPLPFQVNGKLRAMQIERKIKLKTNNKKKKKKNTT